MDSLKSSSGFGPSWLRGFRLPLILYTLLLLLFFHSSFESGQILFSNDAPLGQIAAHSEYPWQGYDGFWMDLYWLGKEMPAPQPNLTVTLAKVLFILIGGADSAVLFMKIYLPLAVLLLGMSSWWFFRQLGFHQAVCLLGGLAAMLNSNSFSNGCWGLSSWLIAKAMIFLAMGIIASPLIRRTWVRLILAGLPVGMAVMEGYDTGAIFSLYFAAFAVVWHLVQHGAGKIRPWLVGAGKVAVIAVIAALVAAHTLSTLVGTQIQGIANVERQVQGEELTEAEKEERWIFATRWSLPKLETVRVLIPGLFGYRMWDENRQPYEKSYWGRVGENPHAPGSRFSGSGEYAGLFVVLLAAWALGQSFRRQKNPYSVKETRMIWFWGGVAFLSLLLAWGRYFPLYSLVYKLPYFSAVRNPIKFTQPMHLALVILFAYGLQDLWRRYVTARNADEGGILQAFRNWWKEPRDFDRIWLLGCGVFLALSLLSSMIYFTTLQEVVEYLKQTGFNEQLAQSVSGYSAFEFLLFVGFLTLTLGLFAAILSGWLSGRRRMWAAGAVFVLLALDLGRANLPWLIYENYREKYATNPVVDRLREEPHRHRVEMFKLGLQQPEAQQYLQMLQQFHHDVWLQHHFPFYQVQSLDIPQEPRKAEIKTRYQTALFPAHLTKYWQLTNTRYLLGLAGFEQVLNQQFDPAGNRFRSAMRFTLQQTAGGRQYEAIVNEEGPFALIEFTGALPRAGLYSNWETVPENQQALERLVAADFNPEQTVVITGEIPPPAIPSGGATNAGPGSVEYTGYLPKRIELSAEVRQPSVLLLNDQYHEHWRVSVDGEQRPLLRCNFLMRGVHLEPGSHAIVFEFDPPAGMLILSLTTVFACLGLIGFACYDARHCESGSPVRPEPDEEPDASGAEQAAPPASTRKSKPGRKKRR